MSAIPVALAGLLLAAGMLGDSPDASPPSDFAGPRTVVCPRLLSEVELAFGVWGGPGTPLRREFFAVVGSRGAQKPGGYVIFGSATPRNAATDAACAGTSASAEPSAARLSKPFVYRRAGANVYFRGANGAQLIGELLHPRTVSSLHLREPNGVGFACPTASGVVVRVRELRSGPQIVGSELRVSHGRALLAIASLRATEHSSFRVSTRCRQD